jgi:hypothetical protein
MAKRPIDEVSGEKEEQLPQPVRVKDAKVQTATEEEKAYYDRVETFDKWREDMRKNTLNFQLALSDINYKHTGVQMKDLEDLMEKYMDGVENIEGKVFRFNEAYPRDYVDLPLEDQEALLRVWDFIHDGEMWKKYDEFWEKVITLRWRIKDHIKQTYFVPMYFDPTINMITNQQVSTIQNYMQALGANEHLKFKYAALRELAKTVKECGGKKDMAAWFPRIRDHFEFYKLFGDLAVDPAKEREPVFVVLEKAPLASSASVGSQ